MKRLLIPAFIAVALSGCAVVPYDQPYYSAAPVYTQPVYPQTYPVQPAYVAPAPVYVGPPVYFGFGLNFRSGGGHYYGNGFRRGYGGWRH